MDGSELKLLRGGFCRDEQGGLQPNSEIRVRLDLVQKIKPLLEKIKSTEEELFSVVRVSEYEIHMRWTSLGRRLLSSFKYDTVILFETFPQCKFNPYFHSFYSIVEAFGFLGQGDHLLGCRGGVDVEVVTRLNECVAKLRQEYGSEDFKRKLNNYRRSGRKNLMSLREYFSKMFAVHARMLMVRVDLSYGKAFIDAREPLHERIQGDRDALMKHVKSGAFGPFLGGVWRLERGLKRGFHYHMLFCFDANVVRQDITIGAQIGQYWQEVITAGKGVYYNCNAFKENYPKPFLGPMHYGDKLALEGLDIYLNYITVQDDLLRLSLPHIRSLGKTGATRMPMQKRGRPRKLI